MYKILFSKANTDYEYSYTVSIHSIIQSQDICRFRARFRITKESLIAATVECIGLSS